MLKQSNPTDSNDLQQVDLQADLVVVGGGLDNSDRYLCNGISGSIRT